MGVLVWSRASPKGVQCQFYCHDVEVVACGVHYPGQVRRGKLIIIVVAARTMTMTLLTVTVTVTVTINIKQVAIPRTHAPERGARHP